MCCMHITCHSLNRNPLCSFLFTSKRGTRHSSMSCMDVLTTSISWVVLLARIHSDTEKSPPLAWIIHANALHLRCHENELQASHHHESWLPYLCSLAGARPYNNPIHWIQHANPWCFEQSNPHTPASALRMFMQDDSCLEATYLV